MSQFSSSLEARAQALASSNNSKFKLGDIDKHFGATHAVVRVTLEAFGGQVLGLVGENGAGKSTVIKIASGVVRPDAGRIEFDGHPLAIHGPRDALRAGVSSVFQELALVPSLTVEENLLLVDQPVRWYGTVDRRQLRRQCQEILARYRLEVFPGARVEGLPLGQRQMVEIVRAMLREPKVLLLDEATSALSAREVEWILEAVKELKASGKIVLFTSHRWEEIKQFCDVVAVMRNGQLVHVSEAKELTRDDAVSLMTGHSVTATSLKPAPAQERVAVDARDMRGGGLAGVSFQLRSGEILGLGGLVGQGQAAVLEALFGVRPLKGGEIRYEGKRVEHLSPDWAIRLGIAYVPQDRKSEGLLLHKSIAFNLTLAILRRVTLRILGLIRARLEHSTVEAAMESLQVRARSGGQSISSLSGGNQQKVLLQKWLLTEPKVLLLNDVTRGVDIATKEQIYQLVAAAAQKGVAVVMYSTDGLELVRLAHRVLVLRDGRVTAELGGAELTPDAIVRAAISKETANVTVS